MAQATVPKGRITAIDGAAIRRNARRAARPLHQNTPRLPMQNDGTAGKASDGEEKSRPDNKRQPRNPTLSLLPDDRVEYNASRSPSLWRTPWRTRAMPRGGRQVDEVDTDVSQLGATGVGEIWITGVTAASDHATGKCICDLPITLD